MKRQPGNSGAKGAGSQRRGLSQEDHALWETTAQSIKPLRQRPRVHVATEKIAVKAGAETNARHRAAHGGQTHTHVSAPVPGKIVASAPPLADFDARKAKKIRAGRLEIERRIDLHGLRQSEAHSRLRRFLMDCHYQGVRHVLVITGKGAPRRHRSGSEYDDWSSPEPGVLRRQVPHWLSEPDLRPIVVSFTTAAAQHGGDGALYVHLRRVDRVV
jgi:DNA-nicking Smr family endonuclease